MQTEIECPICNGSRNMEIVEFFGIEKKKVKVPCTACGGKGKIAFIDLTKPQEGVEIEVPTSMSIADGWRKSAKWNKAHYIAEGRSLCGSVRSRKTMAQSTSWSELDPDILCSVCLKKVNESS